jgi:hypothetical protein
VPIGTQPPESDLWLPLPEPGDSWDLHTRHTHYFGFSVAEAELGGFIYIHYKPTLGVSAGGVYVFRGTDNVCPLDMEYVDYYVTQPWPQVSGQTIKTAAGLEIDFVEPGTKARVAYSSGDGRCDFEMIQTAISPLLVRGHIMPGEEQHHDDPAREPGGSEQFMRVEGEISLNGETWTMDPYAIRDRSWSQVRGERRGGVGVPPMGWTPMCFDGELMLNQNGWEAPDGNPSWRGLYDVPADAPTHNWGWIFEAGGAPKRITRVRREVQEFHPRLHAATRCTMEVEDEDATVRGFTGRAYAMSVMPAWPNVAGSIGVYRWEDEQGRTSDQTYQEVSFDRYFREMTRRRQGAVAT